jgi:MYXO-CTERM domain-containing protein
MLAGTSPAINAGDPAFSGTPSQDQRGQARVVGAHVDMGALELNAGTLQCSTASVSVGESAGMVTLSVTRTGGTEGAVSVVIATADGTATQPADYTQSMSTLNWSNGDSAAKTFNVPIIDDKVAESNETFTATLSNAVGASVGATPSVTVTIDDNDAAPTISAIADQAIAENEATSAIGFTIGDTDDGVSALTVSATSSNHALVEDASVVLGGSGANRTVKVTPKANTSGSTNVTIAVSDGTNTTTATFKVTVGASDKAPTITDIADQTIIENTSTDALEFTIGDPDTTISALTVSAKSSKHSLLADNGITLGGSGAKRTVKAKPLAGKTGDVVVTISVSDGVETSTTSFTLTVQAVMEQAPDAGPGTMGKTDAGTSADASTGGSHDAGTHDASTGGGAERDASKGAVDGGSAEVTDSGEADAGVKAKSSSDCGCSTVGATRRPSGLFLGGVLALLGFASRRRRRTPGCPRCR